MNKRKKVIPVDSVRIVGKDFTVTEVDVAAGIDASNCGHCNYMEQAITVVPSGEQQTKDTLLHEIIHAIEYSVQLKLEEEQVHALAALILQTLWDNPTLAQWLILDEQ